jgi:hypothetical protein
VPQVGADQMMQKGIALYLEKNYRGALKLFDGVIAFQPNREDAWANKALCHLDCDEIPEAFSSCHQALELNPQDGLAWYHLGRAFSRRKNSSRAIEAFKRACSAADGIDDYYRLRAKMPLAAALMDGGRPAEAKPIICSLNNGEFEGVWQKNPDGDSLSRFVFTRAPKAGSRYLDGLSKPQSQAHNPTSAVCFRRRTRFCKFAVGMGYPERWSHRVSEMMGAYPQFSVSR